MQAFAEVLASTEAWSAPMAETYKLLDIDPASVQPLDSYLKVGGVGGGRVMILGRQGGEGRECRWAEGERRGMQEGGAQHVVYSISPGPCTGAA